MKKLFLVLFTCLFLTSCYKDVSGSYKSLHPNKGFDNEIITIEGNQIKCSYYGNARESFHDTSRGKYYSITCSFPYIIEYQGDISKEGDKYTARINSTDVIIDEEEFKSSAWYKTKITKDSLIHYYRDYILNTLNEVLMSRKGDNESVGFQFVVKEDKLILVGGNEVDDYYIKLVE